LKKIEEEEKKDSLQKKSKAIKSESMDDIKEDQANARIAIYSPLSFAALFN